MTPFAFWGWAAFVLAFWPVWAGLWVADRAWCGEVLGAELRALWRAVFDYPGGAGCGSSGASR